MSPQQYKQIYKKGDALAHTERHLINAEEMMAFETHLANLSDHRVWQEPSVEAKMRGEESLRNKEERDRYTVSKCLIMRHFITKEKNSNCTWREADPLKRTSGTWGRRAVRLLPAGHGVGAAFAVFTPTQQDLNGITTELGASPEGGTLYKITGPHFSELSASWNTNGTGPAPYYRVEGHDDQTHCLSHDFICFT